MQVVRNEEREMAVATRSHKTEIESPGSLRNLGHKTKIKWK